jgi:hypothetical protein
LTSVPNLALGMLALLPAVLSTLSCMLPAFQHLAAGSGVNHMVRVDSLLQLPVLAQQWRLLPAKLAAAMRDLAQLLLHQQHHQQQQQQQQVTHQVMSLAYKLLYA